MDEQLKRRQSNNGQQRTQHYCEAVTVCNLGASGNPVLILVEAKANALVVVHEQLACGRRFRNLSGVANVIPVCFASHSGRLR
ncbi:hypothetical protein [Bosea sp. 2KB_26]|uniref:hypothetical protein n=1 Tax=Bosea sp. 2KB_26 TaxID=3237475 RepID=UPI003F9156EA